MRRCYGQSWPGAVWPVSGVLRGTMDIHSLTTPKGDAPIMDWIDLSSVLEVRPQTMHGQQMRRGKGDDAQ